MAGKISLVTAVVCGLIVMCVFIFYPHVLVGFFLNSDNAAARIAMEGFPYFAMGFICFIVNLASIGYYQSLERVKPATLFALLRGFVFLVLSFIFLPEWMGIVGIWLSMPLSEALTTVIIIGYYLFRKPD